MKTDALVSVLVAAYKEEQYITYCLDSIKAQSYPNIELIVIDDCSADKTYEVALAWAEKNESRFFRCEVIKNEVNLGISKNFNKLVQSATGDFVKIIAADDMLFPKAIEIECKHLLSCEDEIVFANCVIVGEDNIYPMQFKGNEKLRFNKPPKFGTNILEELIKKDYIPAPAVMFRKSTFKNYGLFREDLAFEDWEYWLRLASQGCSIGYIDKVIVAYRVWNGGFSHFGNGSEAERRFVKNTETEEKILNEYSVFIKDFDFSPFWNGIVSVCIERNYKSTLYNVLGNKSFMKNKLVKFKLVLYKIHLYRLIFGIVHFFKRRL